jgi:MFS family permease
MSDAAGTPIERGRSGAASAASPMVSSPVPAPSPLPAWRQPFLALEEPGFRNLWLTMLLATFAIHMGMVTTGYVAYDISRSAAAVGFVSLGWGVPMLLFGLWGGVVADRFPKRRTLLLAQSVLASAAVISAALVLSGIVEVWHLAAVAVLQGIGFSFNMPSMQAFIAQLVGRERLMNAIALNNTGANFSRVAGPSLAGALIGVPFVGSGGVFVLMALIYIGVLASLVRLRHSGEPVGASRPPPLQALADGLGYLRHNTVVFLLLLLAGVTVLLGMPYQSLMPVFAADVFDVGPGGLGLLMLVNGIGALVGSLLVASLASFRRRGLLQMLLGIVYGGSLALFAFSGSFELALAVLPVVGFASAGYQALISALAMHYTDPAFHGRVMSVYMLTFSAMPLGALFFGALADRYGAPASIGGGAVLLAGIIAAVGVLYPSYRNIE